MDWHPIQGGVETLLVASCHVNQDKFQPDGPPGSYKETTVHALIYCVRLVPCLSGATVQIKLFF